MLLTHKGGVLCLLCMNAVGGHVMKPITARFWTYHNGSYVKLSIRPGKSLNHHEGGRTDEGWSSYGQIWRHEGEVVTWGQYSDGCDCDGRMSRGRESVCRLTDLKARPAETEPATGYRIGWMGQSRGYAYNAALYARFGYSADSNESGWNFTDEPNFKPVTLAFTKPGIVRLVTSPPRPRWQEAEAYQRDYAAEAMGY